MGFNLKDAIIGGVAAGPLGLVNGAKDLLGGKTKEQTTSTASTTSPWGPQQPYLEKLFSRADSLYKSGGPQFFQGNQVAGLSPDTVEAQNYLRGLTKGPLQQSADAGMGALLAGYNAPNLDKNPYFSGAVDAAINPVVRAFNEDVLPQIRRSAVATGSYGDSRMGVVEGIATDRLQQNLLDMTSRMSLNAYDSGMENSMRALALAPQTTQMVMAPGQILDSIGNQNRAFQQALIDAEMAKWNFTQNAPTNNLVNYQNLITGNYGGTSTGTSTAPVARTNPLMGGLGGAAQGAVIGSVVPGIGTGIGAGIGALLGLFGSQ